MSKKYDALISKSQIDDFVEHDQIARVISEEAPHMRAIFNLYFTYGFDCDEIAKIFMMKEEKIRILLQSMLLPLRRRYSKPVEAIR
ncbi:MAG: hypothetical protein SFU25_01625, partial [Candidatus Caenarcaniphilales bacterium]|nr:hypothetical protein [Candidatus Caenarcaniphilales bacterium]